VDPVQRAWSRLEAALLQAGWLLRVVRSIDGGFAGQCDYASRRVTIAETVDGKPRSQRLMLIALAHEYRHVQQEIDGTFSIVRKMQYRHPLFIAMSVRCEMDSDAFAVRFVSSYGISTDGWDLTVRPEDCAGYTVWKQYNNRKNIRLQRQLKLRRK